MSQNPSIPDDLTKILSHNHPWQPGSYVGCANNNHSRNGDVGRITSYQKTWRFLNSPWEYRVEFSDNHIFWINANSLQLLSVPKECGIPGEDL